MGGEFFLFAVKMGSHLIACAPLFPIRVAASKGAKTIGGREHGAKN